MIGWNGAEICKCDMDTCIYANDWLCIKELIICSFSMSDQDVTYQKFAIYGHRFLRNLTQREHEFILDTNMV